MAKTVNEWEEFFGKKKKKEEIENNRKALSDNRTDRSTGEIFSDRASNKLRNTAFEYTPKESRPEKGVNDPSFDALVEPGLKLAERELDIQANKHFYGNPGGFAESVKPAVLENVIRTSGEEGLAVITNRARKSDLPVVQGYLGVEDARARLMAYQKTGQLSNKEIDAATPLLGESMAENKRYAGLGEETKAMVRGLAPVAVRSGAVSESTIREFVEPGLKRIVGEAKRDYGSLVEDAGGREITDVVRDVVKTVGQKGSRAELNIMSDALYNSAVNN